jgi:hypothetical protein
MVELCSTKTASNEKISLQIALRAAFLEKENSALKAEVKKMAQANKQLLAEKEQLQQQLKALRQK